MMYNKVGIVVKPHQDVLVYLKKTIALLKQRKVSFLLDQTSADLLQVKQHAEREEIARQVDLMIVLGGDGTFLSIAEQAVEAGVPVAGFNLGTLGFLTELKKEYLEENLDEILAGRAPISERKLLEVSFLGQRHAALNDVVVNKGMIARIIKLLLHINQRPLTEIKCDGIIVATPTGSTAYSLSAGGPIVSPDVNGMIINPICPHSLTFRPLIVPDSSLLSIQLLTPHIQTYLTFDGQKVIAMEYQQIVEIRTHPKRLSMMVSPTVDYFRLLSEKLNWGL